MPVLKFFDAGGYYGSGFLGVLWDRWDLCDLWDEVNENFMRP